MSNNAILGAGDYTVGKPLYFHPINIYTAMSGDPKVLICISLINDKSTAYTTPGQIVTDVRSWGLQQATLSATGAITSSGSTIIVHSWTIEQSNEYYDGITTAGDYSFSSLLAINDLHVQDNVNKLN